MQEQPGRSALQNTCALRPLCLPHIGEGDILCMGGRKEEETGNGLGSPEEGTRTMQGLKSASGFIRSELARRVNLRNTPELHFFLDDSIAYGVEMAHRIDEVKAMDEEAERERREKGIDINDVSAYDDMTGDEEE